MYKMPYHTLLETAYVELRSYDLEKHAEELYEAMNEEGMSASLFTYMPTPPLLSVEDVREEFKRWTSNPNVCMYTVYSKRLKRCVGTVSIMSIDCEHGTAELGYIWYSKTAQRTEVNTETIYRLLQYLFEELHYRRVVWKCDTLNTASQDAALRLGFTKEGIFRNHMLMKGRNRDTIFFSIIEEEWGDVKQHIQTLRSQT